MSKSHLKTNFALSLHMPARVKMTGQTSINNVEASNGIIGSLPASLETARIPDIIFVVRWIFGDSKGNIVTATFGGEHGLLIKNQAGNIDQMKTTANISAFVVMVLNWLDLQN